MKPEDTPSSSTYPQPGGGFLHLDRQIMALRKRSADFVSLDDQIAQMDEEIRLLKEQIRVADVAFQGLHERLAALREEAGSDLQLLREVFYARVGAGEQVSDIFHEENDGLWRRVHLRLNPESASLGLS